MNLEKKGLVITISILATLEVIMTLTLNTIAVAGITSVSSSDSKAQISTISKIRLPEDILTYINLSRTELQRHNVTGALAQLDLAAQSVSAIHDKISSISRELSILGYTIRGQNITTTAMDNKNNNTIASIIQSNNKQSPILMEPATYNALVNIVSARQDLHNGNIKGALIDLDSAAQAVSDFTQILLSTANRMRAINDEWIAGG
jgi:hypothetical protein